MSGEHHAALLVDALGEKLAGAGMDISVFGLGSERLKATGAELFEDVAEWSAIGAVSNAISFGRLLIKRKKSPAGLIDDFVKFLIARSPDVIILVDSRVLNLAVAKELRKAGYEGKIVFHVAPVVWESCFDPAFFDREESLARFAEYKGLIDFFFLIYPVSLAAYEKLGLPHLFIGHPMEPIARPTLAREKFARVTRCNPPLDPAQNWIGLFPGSRWEEIKVIAPVMLDAARNLADRYRDLQFLLPVAHSAFYDHLSELLDKKLLADRCALLSHETVPDVICGSRTIIAKSGTVLHLATLASVPMVMVYDFNPLQKWVGTKLLRFALKYYAFPNIIANKAVVPELVGNEFTAENISVEASHLIYDAGRLNKMKADLSEVREKIVRPDPLGMAAAKILELAGMPGLQ